MTVEDVIEQRKAARIALGAKPGSQVMGCKGALRCTVKGQEAFIETGRSCERCDVHMLQGNGTWVVDERGGDL